MKPIDNIAIEYIHQQFYLDDDGNVRNKLNRGGHAHKGDIAGRIHYSNAKNPYRKIGINGREYRAHRIAWVLIYGKWPAGLIDHINHDGLNNHPDNLRDVSQAENQLNPSHGSGIHQWGEQWYCQIVEGQHSRRSRLFELKEDAVAFRQQAVEMMRAFSLDALPGVAA